MHFAPAETNSKLFSNLNEYDPTDSFSIGYKLNGISFGSQSNGEKNCRYDNVSYKLKGIRNVFLWLHGFSVGHVRTPSMDDRS